MIEAVQMETVELLMQGKGRERPQRVQGDRMGRRKGMKPVRIRTNSSPSPTLAC